MENNSIGTITAIVKALANVENGGKVDLAHPSAGKTGEAKSIFQFTPDTWKNYSQQVFKRNDVPLNNDTESYVVAQKVKDWVDQGKSPEQIFSMWNAGESEPDAYTGKFSDGSPSEGVNKRYHIKFDVPEYAKKAMSYFEKFIKEEPEMAQTSTPKQGIASVTPQPTQQVTPEQTPHLTIKTQKLPDSGLLPSISPPTV